MKHRWGWGGGDLLGAYLHCTATIPFETVCKQFINGSVPFSYSLNSGFDTGYDSWFSSGAWQEGTPVQKTACRYRCSVCGGREQGTQRSRLPLPVGSGSLRKKKNPLALIKKLRRKAITFTIRDHSTPFSASSLNMHTLTHSAKICMVGWSRSIQYWCWHAANSKGYHTKGLVQALRFRKKRRHIIQRLHS